MRSYDHTKIEKKWQKEWDTKKLYRSKEKGKKAYVLDMFPYPSGDGLHVGHPKGYIATDIVSRHARMQGKSVLHPMGWDAFGLPAENYAIKNKVHPRKAVEKNVKRFKEQLKLIGLDYDWSREINTTDPEFYKWTQWIFLKLYEKGLAYQSYEPINWCPSCQTGLANEDLEGNACERCGTIVEKRPMRQWVLKITEYAERLLQDLELLPEWQEHIKESQRNWIGKSEGAEIDFPLEIPSHIKRFVLIVGRGATPESNFYPWLKQQLEKRGYDVQIPAIPNGKIASDDEQTDFVIANVKLDSETAVIGHSFGGVIALRLLERGIKLGQVTFVAAPLSGVFLDGKSRPNLSKALQRGFDFKSIKENCERFVGMYDIRDHVIPMSDGEMLLKNVEGTLLRTNASKSHFDGTIESSVLRACVPMITVFTTRPDTLFGVTYMVLSPEHPWLLREVSSSKSQVSNKAEVRKYIEAAGKKTEIERQENKEKTGVKLEGVEAINPATGEKIPVYVADYVLANYGTGAIMAVPAHDERDYEFAKKFNIPVTQVVIQETGIKRENESRRDGGCAVVFDPATQKYAVYKTEDKGIYGLFSGGIDDGESFKDGILREVTEESGLHDFKHVEEIGAIYSHYYNSLKNVNRVALAKCMLIILESSDTKAVQLQEHEKFSLHWTTPDDILENWKQFDTEKSRDHWDVFLRQAVGRARELGYDTTNTDQKFTTEAYAGEGILINSREFDGMETANARAKITEKFGTKKTTYKIRDWVFSRQRYWGEPIPIIHCEKCGTVPVPEKDLPVKLPDVKKYEPTGTGESPLAAIKSWVEVDCPKCVETSKETKYLIFDFDGVLGDTYKVNLQARIDMGVAKDMEESMRLQQQYFSAKPAHARGDHFTPEKKAYHDDWSSRYANAMEKLKFKIFDKFIAEIKKVPNTKIAVVSAGFDTYSKGPLKKSGLKYTHFLAGNHDHSKENKIEKVCKAWGIDVKDAYYFTDTQADVYELENIMDRSKIIGCAWGYQGEQKLRELLPENQVLKKFSDIHNLWKPVKGRRETNTMPQWAGSSWYWLRFMDPSNKKALVDKKKEKYWGPVDLYVGGAEHATRHLIYGRFWHKFLQDIGAVSTPEPFTRLISVGLILAEDGKKMSKRYGNVINPDDIVHSYGADTLRVYEMFMGPFTDAIAWKTASLIGARRFIERVWRLQEKIVAKPDESVERELHKTVKKVGEDIANFKFNTAISQMMIFVNAAEAKGITKRQYQAFVAVLAPFAPHVAEELWRELGNKKTVHLGPWPKYDAKKLVADEVTIVVQINGKVRAQIVVPAGSEEQIVRASAEEAAAKWLEGKTIRKVIFVANRLVNFVID